jgi:hypothetical protein
MPGIDTSAEMFEKHQNTIQSFYNTYMDEKTAPDFTSFINVVKKIYKKREISNELYRSVEQAYNYFTPLYQELCLTSIMLLPMGIQCSIHLEYNASFRHAIINLFRQWNIEFTDKGLNVYSFKKTDVIIDDNFINNPDNILDRLNMMINQENEANADDNIVDPTNFDNDVFKTGFLNCILNA